MSELPPYLVAMDVIHKFLEAHECGCPNLYANTDEEESVCLALAGKLRDEGLLREETT